MNKSMNGQMNIYDFIKPEPSQMPMKEYLTKMGYKNDYFEKPDHECIVEVVDTHEYPNIHLYEAKYVFSFGHIVQQYPQKCGYECHWWKEINPIPVDIVGICDDAVCPICGHEFLYPKENDMKICPGCGQRMDWSRWHYINDNESELQNE